MAKTLMLLLIAFWAVDRDAHAQIFFNAGGQQDWVAMWAFNGRSEEQVRTQLNAEGEMRVAQIDRVCSLNDGQKKKLAKAADADVKRFFRDVAKVRNQIVEMGGNENVNQRINEIWPIVSPLAQRVQQGILADKSLFEKVIRSTLDEQQTNDYQQAMKDDQIRRRKVITRANLAEIERMLPLLSDQREKLLELMDAQELPDKINRQAVGYVGFIKLIKASKRDKQLANILDKHQLAVVNQICDQYRGWENMMRVR